MLRPHNAISAFCIGILVLAFGQPKAHGFLPFLSGEGPRIDVHRLNRTLHGQVHDYTANHGQDRRMTSAALGQQRNVYVYVPPGYTATKRYPLMIWLHGLAQDEKSFLELVQHFDHAMADGTLPKFIIAAPDGTHIGRASVRRNLTLYLNSPLGKFEDYIVYDVWNLAVSKYNIRPERQAHMLAGASMGAFGTYNLGIKHKADFGTLVGFMPPINLRYADCCGRHDTDFDPNCFQWAQQYRPNEPMARFACGLVTIRQKQLVAPVFGEGPDVVAKIAAQNPAEMLFAHDVKPGELNMFTAVGNRDEFNFDAQTESFVALARGKGLLVHNVVIPGGHHNKQTGLRAFPSMAEWIRPHIAPYAPKD